jgi:uncharacterized protein (TIGR03663 family)
MTRAVYGGLILAALACALVFRVTGLDARPMHHDEANQAVKFGMLLETGDYKYDRTDHHGPTLYFAGLPAAWVRGQFTLASLDEVTVRIVPALFGVGLILLFLPIARVIGRPAVVAASWLAALSPALTYYSRFYIQESLFVFFALAFVFALGCTAVRPSRLWALLTGACAGLAYATKETSVIVFVSAVVGLIVARSTTRDGRLTGKTTVGHLVLGLVTALVVAFVLYSSFFRYPSGLMESVRAFGVYLERGVGGGMQAQPWHFYLRHLAYSSSGGVVWTEAAILALAVVGLLAAARRTAGFWLRYLAVYALLMTVVFSLLRYKTTWNLLPFYSCLVLLAGCGAAAVFARVRLRSMRVVLALVFVALCGHLGVQSWRANFRYPADPRNPYVFIQTSNDFLRLVARVNDLAAVCPDHERMLVKVIAGPYEQWPLPWYLRRMPRVGYWLGPGTAHALDDGPVFVVSPDHADAVGAALGDRYVSEFYGLRPDVLLTVFIERPLWERFLAGRSSAGSVDSPERSSSMR